MLGTLTIDSSFYQVALYIRLSREDIKSAKELESESITNQRDLLMRFVNDNNLKLYDCYHRYEELYKQTLYSNLTL